MWLCLLINHKVRVVFSCVVFRVCSLIYVHQLATIEAMRESFLCHHLIVVTICVCVGRPTEFSKVYKELRKS